MTVTRLWTFGNLPHLADAGGASRSPKIPNAGGASTASSRTWATRAGHQPPAPHLGNAGGATGTPRSAYIRAWFAALQARMRDVRVTCGDWSRVVIFCDHAPRPHGGIF